MFIELHALSSFGPSNLNRDDDGYPKEAFFGGYRRARFSSQAFKRAIRTSDAFKNMVGVPNGNRIKRLVPRIVGQLARDGIDQDWAAQWARQTLIELYGKGVAKPE